MKDIKTVVKWISVDNYEKELEFFQEMSLKGWHLTKIVGGIIYKFKKGEPKNYSYQIDYNKLDKTNIHDYTNIFEDSGWEFVYRSKIPLECWNYFRKEVKEGETAEIFTDNNCKHDFLNSVYKIMIVLTTMSSTTFCLFLILTIFMKNIKPDYDITYDIFFMSVNFLLTLHCAKRAYKLNKKIKKMK